MNKTQPINFYSLWIPTALCMLAAIWGIVQMFPAMGDAVHPVSRAAQEILPTVHAAISLNPDATGQALLRWVMYAVTFFVAFAWGQDSVRARQAMNAVVIAAVVYAAYGMVVFFMGSDMAMWVHKPMYQTDVTGPFINKNNFASYLGAVLCVALGLFVRRMVRDTSDLRGAEFWRRLVTCCMGRGAWLVVSIIILFSGLLLTHSRAGLLSFAIAFCVLVGLLRAAGIVRGKIFYWGGAALATVLVALFFLSGEGVFERMVDEGEQARPQLYELDIAAIADRPWLGHGLGSFPQVFQIYRSEDMPPEFFTERAHSVYLENMIELGIPAVLCLFVGIGWLMVRMGASVRNGERHRTIPVVALSAATMLAVHSLIDFPLQIPAITLLFVYLLGLGAAQIKE